MAARGVVVVVAAGNLGADLRGFSPAACDSAITVTAISALDDSPAYFSDWVPDTESGTLKRRVIAAPGVNILSTVPGGTLELKSGTSMAAPHVTGVAALCFATGACRIGDAYGLNNTRIVLDAVWAKAGGDATYSWNKGSVPVRGSRYFGPLVWAGAW